MFSFKQRFDTKASETEIYCSSKHHFWFPFLHLFHPGLTSATAGCLCWLGVLAISSGQVYSGVKDAVHLLTDMIDHPENTM